MPNQLTKLAGELFKTNTAIIEKRAGGADPANYQDPTGPFSGEDNSIPTLMRRGAVDGAVLIPGAAGTLPELQRVGFH